jgi:hypothetical protein
MSTLQPNFVLEVGQKGNLLHGGKADMKSSGNMRTIQPLSSRPTTTSGFAAKLNHAYQAIPQSNFPVIHNNKASISSVFNSQHSSGQVYHPDTAYVQQ